MVLLGKEKAAFQETVWQQGKAHYRVMPWRSEPTFYNVLVSELMLQQTQVSRVVPKFHEFIAQFPNESSLATAPLSVVLRAWQGLGYNRRAKYLHSATQHIVAHGTPKTLMETMALPGVGKNTAGAMMNYVYQQATPFVETNIRTVYFHHFFQHSHDVPDTDICELVAATMDGTKPRQWFWALMDYGAVLKQQGNGALKTSKHYKKQSPLKGSIREMRGRIIASLTLEPMNERALRNATKADETAETAERFAVALSRLHAEHLIVITASTIRLEGSDAPSGV